jgi:hypothetical protein
MSDRKLSGSIALTKLQHVVMEKKGKSGMIKGIFIPIDANMLTEKDGAVYMAVNVNFKTEQDQYGQNGFISKTTDSKIWKSLDEEGKKKAQELSPILGNIKDFSAGGNDAAGAASTETIGEDDDLPF